VYRDRKGVALDTVPAVAAVGRHAAPTGDGEESDAESRPDPRSGATLRAETARPDRGRWHPLRLRERLSSPRAE
jgi:hypothetical protein